MQGSAIFRRGVVNLGFVAAVFLRLVLSPTTSSAQTQMFNFEKQLFGDPTTLWLWVVAVDSASGVAELNGVETQSIVGAFTWLWGDGASADAFFPQTHTYTDVTRNYVVTVISHYSDGGCDSAQTLVRFVPTSYQDDGLPSEIRVSIPSEAPPLGTRLYPVNPNLTGFDDSFFHEMPRDALESILTVVAAIEMDFTNDDVYLFENKFEQVMLRDASFGGAYSLWFTDPVSFGVGDGFLGQSIGYSSLMHEMGHNFSLNTPGDFYYGGRIDGYANAIYSETLAQIYQHAASYVLLNSLRQFRVDDDLAFEIKNSATSSIGFVRDRYDAYINDGMNFNCWDDPPQDATMETFMTIAYKFFEHAENSGMGYRAPLKRMMHLLQLFDQDLMDAYGQNNDTPEADAARATLLVAAVSYAFLDDLRGEFTALNFPIDDDLYEELMAAAGWVNTVPALNRMIADTTLAGCFDEYAFSIEDSALFYDPDGDFLTYYSASSDDAVASTAVIGTTLQVYRVAAGEATITITADDGNGGTESTAFVVAVTADCDGDGIAEDGDNSGVAGDNPCHGGATSGCDDNCFGTANPDQLDGDDDGVGNACEPCACPSQCDYDDDGYLTALDLGFLIDVLFAGWPEIQDPHCPTSRGDFNYDGYPDALDIGWLIDHLFAGGEGPRRPCD